MRWARIAVLLPLLAACAKGGAAGDGEEAGGESVPVVAARTATAQVQDFPVTVTALGVVEVPPGRQAALAAPALARVAAVYVSTGQRVTAGQPLVALDQTVFAAEVRRAEVARVTAQQAYDRARRLADAGILPRKDAEAAASALADANAALVQARSTRSQAVLRSPISGVVSAVSARLNAQADPSQTLVQVVDPRALEVHLAVPPDQAARVGPREPVRLSAGRAAGGPLLGDGVVTGIGAVIDTASGSVDVRATLTHPVGTLFVGEDVFASIEVASRRRAVTVPAEAVVPGEEGSRVFVVDPSGVARARPVTVGERHETVVEIAQGLRGGETVVASGAYGVQDGARVRRTGP